MLTYLRTDLFSSPAQTLVNAVNTVGVMGKGIAKTFKEGYPEMFLEYKKVCDSGRLRIGSLMLWRGPNKWVLNFPTKTTWRLPSQLSYIEDGLKRFVTEYEDLGITSISFPPLGCGNGNLSWSEVGPLMERYLKEVSIPVYVHDRQVEPDFWQASRRAAEACGTSSLEPCSWSLEANSSLLEASTGPLEACSRPCKLIPAPWKLTPRLWKVGIALVKPGEGVHKLPASRKTVPDHALSQTAALAAAIPPRIALWRFSSSATWPDPA